VTLDINSYATDIRLDTYINSITQKRPVPIRLVYDTGATGLSLSESFLEFHGFGKVGTTFMNTANGRVEVGKYYIPDFWILGEDFGDVVVTSCKISGLDDVEDDTVKNHPGFVGVLGFHYLRGFDTTLDFTNKQIHFEPRHEYIKSIRTVQPPDHEVRRDMLHMAMRGQIILTPEKELTPSNRFVKKK